MRVFLVLAMGLVSVLTACDDGDPPGTDAGGLDAGASSDAGGGVDGGDTDAGGGVDAGDIADAGDSDAGAIADAGDTDAASSDGGDPCGFFDGLERGCTNDESCSNVVHQIDCCGTFVARGVNHSERTVFDMLEPVCQASYPACGCASLPTMTDSGETVTDPATVQVGCIPRGPMNICMTYVSMRPEARP